MSEFRNNGITILCTLICIWPMIFWLTMRALELRVKSRGWRSLLPPYGGRKDVSL